ncbi:MAG: GTP cyclohydrolase II [Bradyrhizobium sp.]
MSSVPTPTNSALFGNKEHLSVSRALSELQARRPIRVNAPGEVLFALPVEGLEDQRLREFAVLCDANELELIVTQHRARAIGIETSTPMALPLSRATNAGAIFDLASDRESHFTATAVAATLAATAAIRLIKLSGGLPAVLAARVTNTIGDLINSTVTVEADAVECFAVSPAKVLTVASDASIPLASGKPARFVVFRDAVGVDQVAIIVGKPNFAEPVPVRLHSSCLTGDVFGSRRCDCGDQLQIALARLEDLGGGVILYLAQEGRGIGLANKMRAYRLQDAGLDTRDANTMLGFEDDERDYGAAALILRTLNCTRIVLLTNNPAKLDGLAKAGIEVVARAPLEAPINPHNRRYLTTKAVRSGHKIVTLKASAGETS